jgi:hypothetical protein
MNRYMGAMVGLRGLREMIAIRKAGKGREEVIFRLHGVESKGSHAVPGESSAETSVRVEGKGGD